MQEGKPYKLEAPSPSKSIFSDIRKFFIHKPEEKTLIRFQTKAERQNYRERILQRLNTNVEDYMILNIHQIGIDAPTLHVFEELLKWNGDSTCWPNNIARVYRVNGKLDNINIYPLGKKWFPFGFSPLFSLHSLRIQDRPDTYAFDNARYLLYKCEGGYPIGIFSMYVRSSIADMGEPRQSQLFFIVGFNFYGNRIVSRLNPLNLLWKTIHNRVTANTMFRFKQLIEWKFNNVENHKGIK